MNITEDRLSYWRTYGASASEATEMARCIAALTQKCDSYKADASWAATHRSELADLRSAFAKCEQERDQLRAEVEQMTNIITAAKLFCESTIAEMDELNGTQSASAPVEFMLLHEAVQEFAELKQKEQSK